MTNGPITATLTAPWKIRDEIRNSDREAVRRLTAATGYFHPCEVDVAVELVDERLARGVASGYEFLFADVDDRLAAYACYGFAPCTAATYELYWLATDPAFQGLGLGSRLLEESEHRIAARGGRQVYIETSGRPLYNPTRAFYLARGYEQVAQLEDFYDEGDAKVIYCKNVRTE